MLWEEGEFLIPIGALCQGRHGFVHKRRAGLISQENSSSHRAQSATANDVAGGWGVNQASSVNYVMIRYADVLLWAAEAEIEVGSLDKAEDYVNMVRNRAAKPETWVHTYVDNNDPSKGFTNTPAANYKIIHILPGILRLRDKIMRVKQYVLKEN